MRRARQGPPVRGDRRRRPRRRRPGARPARPDRGLHRLRRPPQRATWVILFGEGRFGDAAGAIRAEQAGLIAQLLRELPGSTGEPDAEQLDAVAHVFVGAAESIAFWAVDHPDVPLERVADHLMTVLWPVVRDLPRGGATGGPPPAPGRSAPSR